MNDIEILEELRHELGLYANGEKVRQGQAIENLIQRNKNLEQKEVMLKEKLERDIEDDNCMWVDNKEKIVTSAKTLVDRSAYAKEIKELLGDEK